MNRVIETQVLVVGAGPVGMTMTIDLARRGIDVVLAEMRPRGELPHVKCNHVSARSMEIFRRLGIADTVRSRGLPPDFPNDVVYNTSVAGIEMARIHIPGRNQRFTSKEGHDTWWPTPEPAHRINQIYLEPAMFEHIAEMKHVTTLNHLKIDDFTQNDHGVTATATDLDSGEKVQINCLYLIGCDGGRSSIRRKMGAAFHGDDNIQKVQTTYIRAPKLLGMMPAPAWKILSMNPRRCGNTLAIDGRETWLVHTYIGDGEDFETADRDASIRAILGVGLDFEYEMLAKEDWVGKRLMADKFRKGRVFICGDAAHIWVSYGGYGMNAGIADAENLSWLLAAHLNGWAPESILAAHELERLPITEQVSHFAMSHAKKIIKQRAAIPAAIEFPGPEGDAVRAEIGKKACDLNIPQYCPGGLNFGYFYQDSPIISYDGEAAPSYGMYEFTPSTAPGCRTPHLWLKDGRSLYDAAGPEYTLLRFDASVETAPLMEAARKRGVPLSLVDVLSDETSALYAQKLVLSRPDQHVAWRGNQIPADPLALIDLVRGASGSARKSTLDRVVAATS